MDARLKRIQAKLFAYLAPLPQVIRRYPLDDASVPADIAHAVYYMRRKDLNAAQKYLHRLLTAEPQNPYFGELKAQSFYESGSPRDAVNRRPTSSNLPMPKPCFPPPPRARNCKA